MLQDASRGRVIEDHGIIYKDFTEFLSAVYTKDSLLFEMKKKI